MRRFGLPILLSACYAGLLLLVFNSDFGRENSFLLREESAQPKAKALEMTTSRHGSLPAATRISSVSTNGPSVALAASGKQLNAGHSPESAAAQP